MKKRVFALAFSTALLVATLAGCGGGTAEADDAGNKTGTSASADAASAVAQPESVPKEAVHEHSFVYTFDGEGGHKITCVDAECDYSEGEACSYDDGYVCEFCGNKHEHTVVYASNGDATHGETCEACGYTAVLDCALNEEYVCGVCGWTHEHDCIPVPNEDATHTFSCKYDVCTYSYAEECEYSGYECVCGRVYPWEEDIRYFDESKKGTYYAQKELNVYRYPNADSEVMDTLSVDEGVNCVGSVFYGSGANYECYYITESGGCIPVKFHQSTSRWDLRIAKTSQVVARCGSNYTVYDSYDVALQSICGCSWSTVKQSWTYNDYKSQGLPFMNSYSQNGITVATKDGSVPYNCSMNGAEYYFE